MARGLVQHRRGKEDGQREEDGEQPERLRRASERHELPSETFQGAGVLHRDAEAEHAANEDDRRQIQRCAPTVELPDRSDDVPLSFVSAIRGMAA